MRYWHLQHRVEGHNNDNNNESDTDITKLGGDQLPRGKRVKAGGESTMTVTAAGAATTAVATTAVATTAVATMAVTTTAVALATVAAAMVIAAMASAAVMMMVAATVGTVVGAALENFPARKRKKKFWFHIRKNN